VFLIQDESFCVRAIALGLKLQLQARHLPYLKMSWDHASCENSHVELQTLTAKDLQAEEKPVRCLGRFSKALVKQKVR